MSAENSSDLQETAYQQQASLDHANTQAPKTPVENPQLNGMSKSYALAYHQLAKARLSETEYAELRFLIKQSGKSNDNVVPTFAKLSCLLQDYPNLMRGFRVFLPPGLQLPFQTGVFLLLRKMQIEEKESSSHTDVNCKLETMSNSQSEEQMFEASTSQGTNSNLSQSDSLDTREDQNLLKKISEKYVNSFLYKVKDRFKEEPQIFDRFVDLLDFMSNRNQLETDALLEILDLFQGHEDLIAEFKSFIPNVEQESASGQEEEEEGDTSETVPTVQDENFTSQYDSTDISRITAVNDPSIASVYKYGTYEDHLFFDQVKAALGYEEVYNNFLRCLMLFTEDIVTRSELVQIITPFLGTFPELYKKFKDMLGFNDNGDNVEYIPMKIIRLENARNKSGIAADIDFSAGGRNGASYLPLAPDFKHPKCSGRTPLCDEVLNDTWVSFPTWSEDSTFVQSCKTQYEEVIYRCEDERFELDMAISSNSYTLQILDNVQKNINKMTAEEKSMYSLDNYLGGTSLVLQRKALHRLYGDKTEELVEGLKRNPVVAVPIILKRLKVKEDEWKEKEREFNEVWRRQINQFYLKSLDHQGINFKQNDSKTFRPKGILNDLEMVIAENKANPQQMEPHFQLEFKEVEVFLDAINLMLQYLKKLPGVYRDDRRKIELVIRSFIPYMFDAPSATKIGNDLEIDEETQGGDSMDVDNDGKERSGQNSSAGSSKDENEGSSEEDSNEEAQSDESDKAFIEEIDVFDRIDPLPTTNMPYTLFFVSKIWFVFFRQFHILFERLARFLHESNSKEAPVKQDGNEEENPKSLYKELIESLTHLLNGVIDYSQFEDKARSLFGIHAYFSFTMDKLILSIVRQLQQVVADDICKQSTAFFNQHTKKISTGGCTSGVEASQIEHQYLRKVEKMMDNEQVFKVIFHKNLRILTIDLLEIEETSPDPIEAEKWSNYLDTYFDEDFCCEELLAEVQQVPVFLRRNLRKQMLFWKNRVMHVEKQWHQRQSSKSMKKHLPLSARKKRALSIIAPILRKKPRRLSIPESSVQPSCSGVVSNDGNEPHSFDNSETIKPEGKFFEDNKKELDAKEQLNKIIGDDQVTIGSEENLEKPDIPEKEENFLGNESVVIDAVSSPNAQTEEVSVESPKSLPEIADKNSKETAADEATKEAEKMEVDKDAYISVASPEETDDSVIELEDASEKNISEEKSEDVMVPESSLKATDSDTDMKSKGDMAENSVSRVLETNKDRKEEEHEAVEDSKSVEKTDETESQAEKSIGKKQLKRRVIQKTSEYSIKTRKNRIKRKMKRGLLRSSNSSKRKQRQTKRKFEVLDDPTFDFAYFSELPESDKVSHLAFKYVTVEDNEEVTFTKGSNKIRFVQNHGLFAHRKDSLTRAQETHQAVSEIKASNFNAWHRIWLERYVTPSMMKSCNDWLLRSDPEKFKLFRVTVSDCTKPPYIPYNKYKVCHFKTVT